MNKILKYKFLCVTEGLEKEVLLDDTRQAPGLCPDNSSHVISIPSMNIYEVYDSEIKPFRQVLGEDDYTMNPRAMKFVAPANATSIHYKQINHALAVKGGIFYAKDSVVGDKLQVFIEDKDNVLGYGAGLVLKDYVPEWYVMPNIPNELMDVSIGKLPVANLYLKVVYENTSNSDISCVLNLISYIQGA